MFSWMRLSPLALLVLISLACSGNKQQPAPQANTAQLTARPAQQTAAPANNPSQQQLAAMQAELAARDARIKELETARAGSSNKDPDDPKIAGVASTYDRAKRELTVTLQPEGMVSNHLKNAVRPGSIVHLGDREPAQQEQTPQAGHVLR